MPKIAIVTKNVDFTEGRGPMIFYKAFSDEQKAVHHIMEQHGIYGSKQCETKHGYEREGERSFNGYDLIMVELE